MMAMILTAAILLQDSTAAVHEALEKSELRGKAVELVDGRRGYLLRAVDGTVEAVLFTDLQTIAWHDLTPETVVRLAGKDSIDVAAYLLKRDRTAEAHAMLAKILSEDSSRASDVEAVLAEGGALPEGGFGWDDQIGFYPGGKRALLAWRKACAAAVRVERARNEKKFLEASGDLKAMAEASEFGPFITRLAERAARRRTEAMKAAAAKRVLASSAYKSALRKARRRIAKGRAAALKLITNPAVYSAKDHGAKAQPKIDVHLEAVTKAWSGEWIEEVWGKSAKLLAGVADPGAVRARVRASALADLRTVPAAAKKQGVIEFDERVTQHNLRFELPADAPPNTREQALVLNAYRHMLGLRMLFFDARLARAAQKHAGNMDAKGTLYHNMGKDTMRGRIRAEGFSGGIGENVQSGTEDHVAAHAAWAASPGHHRNMIAEQFSGIGVGRSGSYWCQTFGNMKPPASLSP